MSSLRQLELRLAAWRSFCGIAGATRTLAAAQTLQWADAARRAEAHLERCLALRDAYPTARPSPSGPAIVLGLGSDLGLCGPFNRVIAERLQAEPEHAVARRLVVGARLGALLGDTTVALAAPTSFERVEMLASELELLLDGFDPARHPLRIVLATKVDPDGHPLVDRWDEPEARPVPPGPVAELADPGHTASLVAAITRHARVVAALVRSAASETEARWRTMNRAHDAAERRIGEQERELRKRRQELVTQQMLEARQGARPG